MVNLGEVSKISFQIFWRPPPQFTIPFWRPPSNLPYIYIYIHIYIYGLVFAHIYISVYILDMAPYESFLLARNGTSKLKQLVLITFLLLEHLYICIHMPYVLFC